MSTPLNRTFSLKNEELPVVCNFAISSFTRDLKDFSAFSPRFTPDYVSEFTGFVTTAQNVLRPKSEMIEQKRITSRIFSTLDGLVDPLNRLTIYLQLPGEKPNISLSDFGVKGLRKCIQLKDIEGAMNNLNLININLAKYKEQLAPQGLTDDLIALFSDAALLVAADKQKQYELIIHRKAIVQNNTTLFNTLYGRLTEVLSVGKALYKNADPSKCHEYTLNDLKKRVHRATSSPAAEQPPSPAV